MPSRTGHTHGELIGHHAAWFDRASNVALRWLYRRVARLVVADVAVGGSVLDVGTGPGHLLVAMARQRPDLRLTGIDPSADMVGHAVRRARAAGVSATVDVRSAAAEALPFDDAAFDAVLSTLSAHHWSDVAASVAEQLRVLRPGGSLWVVDLRRGPLREVVRRLRSDPSTEISPVSLGRIASVALVGYRAKRR